MILEICGFIITFSSAVVICWKMIKWLKKLQEGQRCQLRSEMLRIYYAHNEQKKMKQIQYENFIYCYNAYKALGGNSFIDKVKDEIMGWEIEE